MPPLTPLALACSLGDIPIVEALCQWAQREKVHIDPTAPTALGSADGDRAATGTTLWWDRDEQRREDGEGPHTGDPPMVMAVRSRANLATKLRLIGVLAQYGFSADVRSPVDSWTPLLAAVDSGCLDLVIALVKLGARLSADRHLGFTPLHLACQMGHWHLVPFLTDAMTGQYSRVAAWGPSPQYVSLNLVDSYGRTALDIAILGYFANPLPCGESCGKPPSLGSEQQKAVDILREFVHQSPPTEPGVVCGWDLLRVLRFLDTLPSRKAVGAQLWGAEECESLSAATSATPPKPSKPAKAMMETAPRAPCRDAEELPQAVRVLVRAGGKTRWLLQDLLQPPSRIDGSDVKESITALGPRLCQERLWTCSPLDPEDMDDLSGDDAPL